MRNVVVFLQIATMVVLGVYFFRDGLWRLGCAQVAYCFATLVLFAR